MSNNIASQTQWVKVMENGHVATISLERTAAKNAFNYEMIQQFAAAVELAGSLPDVRSIIVHGQGDFSSGLDVRAAAAGELPSTWFEEVERAFCALEDTDRLVVAAVDGLCLGGGLQMLSVCDLAIGTSRSTYGIPAMAEAGFLPGLGVYRLPRMIGLQRARTLLFGCRILTAGEALDWGLLGAVVSAEQLLPAARQAAQAFAGVNWKAGVVGKRLMNHAQDTSRDQALEYYLGHQGELLAADDHRTAIKGAMEALRKGEKPGLSARVLPTPQ